VNAIHLRHLLCHLALIGALGPVARGQELPSPDYREATVVVFNNALPASRQLAETYAKARRIPAGNLVGLKMSTDETISRAEYTSTLADPLRKVFTEKTWWVMASGTGGPEATSSSRRVIALMSGVPLRIREEPAAGTTFNPATPVSPTPSRGQQTDAASVDSELTLLGLPGVTTASVVNNPYFRKDEAFVTGAPAALMLVGRIDGPTFPVCERMIADATIVEKTGLWGRVYLDLALKGPGYEEGDAWLVAAGRAFGTRGWPVLIDAHPQTLPTNFPMNDAAVYLGWYTRSPDGPFLNGAFQFRRGAVATHLHSFSAAAIRGKSTEWCGPLLAKGAAAVLGNTWEPFLGLTTHLNLFSERLLKGYTLAEAAWMATPGLSWMNVVLGDPLYRPFAHRKSSPAVKGSEDFQIYQALVAQHGTEEDKEKLLRAVEAAALRRQGGVLWEALGVLVQTYAPGDMKRAAAAFEKAAKAYPKVPDKIRCYLQVPDMQRRANQTEGAILDLNRIISEFPEAPETEAARSWLSTLQPSPPTPPSPPSGRRRRNQ
jgi:uncharacterized protein (TIGR03790 family)